MDSKLKWGAAFCTMLLCAGIYIDNPSAVPVDFNNPSTLTYKNMLLHADKNVAAAQYVLGTFYLYGRPTEKLAKDPLQAQAWFKKAADNAHTPAAFEYARLISQSDPKQAETYFRQAMAGGFTASIFALSQLKIKEGTPASVKEGLALLYTSSKAKDPLGLAYFSTLQYEGAGVEKDRVGAVLGMQQAVSLAPTPETKKDWDTKQAQWFAALTVKEQEDLNERLMANSTQAVPSSVSGGTPAAPEAGLLSMNPADISALLANMPVNKPKPVGK